LLVNICVRSPNCLEATSCVQGLPIWRGGVWEGPEGLSWPSQEEDCLHVQLSPD